MSTVLDARFWTVLSVLTALGAALVVGLTAAFDRLLTRARRRHLRSPRLAVAAHRRRRGFLALRHVHAH